MYIISRGRGGGQKGEKGGTPIQNISESFQFSTELHWEEEEEEEEEEEVIEYF